MFHKTVLAFFLLTDVVILYYVIKVVRTWLKTKHNNNEWFS